MCALLCEASSVAKICVFLLGLMSALPKSPCPGSEERNSMCACTVSGRAQHG